MKLNKLIDTNLDIDILGITDDSRMVRDGYLFVATKGYNVDHYDYISDAIKNGCVFVVADKKVNYDIPNLIVDDIDDFYRELCLKLYNISSDDFNLIGVTGTDGKTTTATVIKELIGNCAYIGTNGLTIKDKTIPTNNTTPCISELYDDLRKIKKEGIKSVSMEVSSEALLHNRLVGFLYDIVAFTNITGDHLNVHKSFDNYLECKLKLLDFVKEDGIVIVNGDDSNLKKIKHKNKYSFGFNKDNNFIIKDVKYEDMTIITLVNKDKEYLIESPYKGKYNVYNIVEAFLVALFFGIDEEVLIDKIKKLKPVNGRCEFLDFGQDFDIVLDYAHTTNGIRSILSSFKDYNYNRIITVTGCAGGREKEKRPVIGKMVMELSDISIFTMDDPRYESVDDIIDQMVEDSVDYIRIVDRVEAISYALSIADKGDVVLILGKGRDNYMAIEDKKVKYNDYEVIKDYYNK